MRLEQSPATQPDAMATIYLRALDAFARTTTTSDGEAPARRRYAATVPVHATPSHAITAAAHTSARKDHDS